MTQVPLVAERLPAAQPDLVPDRRRAAARWRPSASTSGRSSRSRPGSCAVKASVARTTTSAAHRAAVRAHDAGLDRASTAVFSWIVTPRPLTASASPRTSLAGCSAAQCGVYVPPSARVTPTVARSSSAASSRSSSSPNPQSRQPATSPRARPSCAALRAADTYRRGAKSQSMPSAAATRPTSSTVSSSPAACATAPSRPARGRDLAQRRGEDRRAPAAVAPATRRSRRSRARARRRAARVGLARGSRRSTAR